MKLNKARLILFFTIFIIISPIVKQYSSPIPGVSWADLIFLLLVIVIVGSDKKVTINSKTRMLLVFWLVTTFLSGMSFLYHQNFELIALIRYIKYTFYIFIVLLSISYFDFKLGVKWLVRISVAISIYIIVQYFVYNILGIVLPFKILPFPWASGSDFNIKDVEYIASRYFYRPSGIFIEPAAAAQFLLPGLIFAIYNDYRKKYHKNIVVILLISSIYLTTSTQGLVVLLFIIATILYKTRKNPMIFTLVTGVSIISLIIFSTNFEISELINRNILAIENIQRGSSLGVRIFRGYAVFKLLPLVLMLIGVGHGNLGNYVISNQIITKYDPVPLTEAFAEFANAFSLVLLYYGLIGGFLFLMVIIDIISHVKGPFKLLGYVYCLLMLSSGVFFNVSIIFYFSLLYSGYRKEADNGI